MNIGFIILYVTGSPSKDEKHGDADPSLLQMFTILNVSASKFKVISVFFQCMIVIAGMTMTFMFKYMTKFQNNGL